MICYNNEAHPPFIYLYQPLEFRTVTLRRAADVVRYSFLTQRSVTFLDLSLCEFRRREKTIYTKEAFKNRIDVRRRTLYRLNLDLVNQFESGPPKNVPFDVVKTGLSNQMFTDDDFCFYFHEVEISCKHVYGHDCKRRLKLMWYTVSRSESKIDAVLKCVRQIAEVKCTCNFQRYFKAMFRTLLRDHEHSALILNFIKSSDHLLQCIFDSKDNEELEFILFHACQLKCDIFGGYNLSLKQMIFSVDLAKIPVLIKYGYHFPFFGKQYAGELKKSVFPFVKDLRHKKNIFEQWSRRLLFYQTLNLFFFGWRVVGSLEKPTEALCIIMETVPDPYFTYNELQHALRRLGVCEYVRTKICVYYETYVTDHFYTHQPRALSHLVRCKIRELLSYNFEVPGGIDKLKVPDILKSFLKYDDLLS